MYQINDDKSIYVTRGDIVNLFVTADNNGAPYTFVPGDVVRIKVFGKKDCTSVVLQKDFPITEETESVEIVLDERDTKIGEVISKPVDYWYEIELNPLSDPQTIIGYDEDGAKVFKLFPEGRDLEEYEYTEEDIPFMDAELDLTSTRPVENQAIARAVAQLKGAIVKAEETTAESVSNVSDAMSDLASKLAVERTRIDSIAALAEGSTTGDAELIDARNGCDTNVYANVGDAIRMQVGMAKEDIKHLVNDIQAIRTHGDFVNATLQAGVLNKNYRYRVSTDTIISFEKKTTLYIADGFRLAIHEFVDGVFSADWGWRTGSVTINAGVGFKCMIARTTDNTTEEASTLEFTNAITFEAEHLPIKKALQQSVYAIDNVKARYMFVPGDIKADVGEDFDVNFHRIRTSDICYTPNDIVIVGNGLYRVYLYTYDDKNYTNAVDHGWVVSGDTDYTIAANTYFKLLIAHLDDNSVSYAEIEDVKTSDLYCKLEIYTKAHQENKKSILSIVNTKSNIESVAHQGFSTTSQYFGNCRLSAIRGAYLNGFDCAEIDVKFASDGVPVCCHDTTFTDTNDNSTVITIADHTAAELKNFGYYGETIATLEDVVAECKRFGIGLYIDHISYINTEEKWNSVFGVIKKYAMQNNVVWLAYSDKIAKWNSEARFAIVAHTMSDAIVSNAVSVANAGHKVNINVNHENCSVDQIIEYNAKLPSNVSIGVWTIDDLDTYEAYKPYVCAITSNKLSDLMTNKN